MANTLPIISFLFSILLSLIHSTRSTPPVCEKRYCGSPEPGLPFEFPFLLRESNDNNNNNQSDRCGYPGFDVFCNHRKQAILTLSKARKFVVKFVSLEKQRVWINDPEGCLPRLFLGNIDLTEESPFQLDNTYSGFVNLTLFNCTKSEVELMVDDLHPIPCLSNDPKYSIAYDSHSQPLDESWIGRARSCHEMGFASVPVKGDPSSQHVISDGLYDDIALRWITSQCNCEADQYCGFSTDTGYNVTCYNNNNHINSDHQGGNPSPSLHKSVYFFPIVWGVSALLFIFWVILSICKERQRSSQQQRQTSIESNNPEPRWFVLGLDRSRIEKYPKIQLAESGQLPKSIDNVCSICLSEYKPKETLRSMPQCNHHFHVECIDVWLKMNATCPLCRNLPEGSALVISSLSHSTISHQSTS